VAIPDVGERVGGMVADVRVIDAPGRREAAGIQFSTVGEVSTFFDNAEVSFGSGSTDVAR
jgi:hypothetical protein